MVLGKYLVFGYLDPWGDMSFLPLRPRSLLSGLGAVPDPGSFLEYTAVGCL